ncbi:MAG: exodeoxyribonuclease VII large subunit, partial [Gemmatimonadaceae bacterium]
MKARQPGPGERHAELFEPAALTPYAPPNEASRVQPPAADPAPGATPASAIDVSVLTAIIRDLLEGAFLPLWIRGEVSGFKRYAKSGHWYFTLRGDNAVMKCVMWQQDARRMPAAPDEGMSILALGAVRMFPKG